MIKKILSIVSVVFLMVSLTNCGPSQEEINRLRILEIKKRNNKIYYLINDKIKKELGDDSYSSKFSIRRLNDTLILYSIYSSKYLNLDLIAQVDSFNHYSNLYLSHMRDIKETLYLLNGNYREYRFNDAYEGMENDYNKIKEIHEKVNKISSKFSNTELMGYFGKYIFQLRMDEQNRSFSRDTIYFIVDTSYTKITEYTYIPFGVTEKAMKNYYNEQNKNMLDFMDNFETIFQNKTVVGVRQAIENHKENSKQ